MCKAAYTQVCACRSDVWGHKPSNRASRAWLSCHKQAALVISKAVNIDYLKWLSHYTHKYILITHPWVDILRFGFEKCKAIISSWNKQQFIKSIFFSGEGSFSKGRFKNSYQQNDLMWDQKRLSATFILNAPFVITLIYYCVTLNHAKWGTSSFPGTFGVISWYFYPSVVLQPIDRKQNASHPRIDPNNHHLHIPLQPKPPYLPDPRLY